MLFAADRCKTVGTKQETWSESKTMSFDKKQCISCQFLPENKLGEKLSLLEHQI